MTVSIELMDSTRLIHRNLYYKWWQSLSPISGLLGGGQKKFMKTCIFHVYRIESKYGFQLVHRCIWQKLQYIVGFEVLQTTLWARCWSIGNANCLENIFAPKNLNLGTEEHMCPIYTLCNNFLTQFPKHLCFNMTTTILKTHLILKTTYSVSMPYPIVA